MITFQNKLQIKTKIAAIIVIIVIKSLITILKLQGIHQKVVVLLNLHQRVIHQTKIVQHRTKVRRSI